MNARSALSLVLALITVTPLTACADLDDFFRLWSGQPTKAQARTAVQPRVTGAMLVAPPPAAPPPAAPEPVAETPPPVVVAEVPPPMVVPEPPAPVYEYDRYNADPVGYQCQAVFRSLSCLDDGRPVYLDSQMGQMPFGTHP